MYFALFLHFMFVSLCEFYYLELCGRKYAVFLIHAGTDVKEKIKILFRKKKKDIVAENVELVQQEDETQVNNDIKQNRLNQDVPSPKQNIVNSSAEVENISF